MVFKTNIACLIGLLSLTTASHAKVADAANHPLYAGAAFGHGSTTWQGLVPNEQNKNMALGMSTPVRVEEGGLTYGLFLGFEFTPTFALEANYARYPKATVFFDSSSLFSFNNDDKTEFDTHTEAFNLMGKIFMPLTGTYLRFYSSFGVAEVHREDLLINHWRLSPTFGVGVNYTLSEHFMTELAGNYTAGYGESQLEPSANYFPFLYSVLFRLAYRF
ncbi:MAG: outer membrane beta-barrel protein [Tatlockia sp.]|jgi:hypothetical protein